MLSDYCKEISNKHGISVSGFKKLVLNLSNKSKYVIHNWNLQLCLKLGMRPRKSHRVRKFKRSHRLKQYINFIVEKEKWCKQQSWENFFKLMDNSVYSKARENLRNRVDLKLVANSKDYKKSVTEFCFAKDILQKIKCSSQNQYWGLINHLMWKRSCYNDKRYILDDEITSLAYRHKLIN